MLISLRNIVYYYSKGTAYEIKALDNISTDFKENEFVGVIGHTGSGKSTFLQLLNGLEKPTEGDVSYKGENIWDKGFNRKSLRAQVGLVFQYPEHQLFESTVLKDVCYGPKNFGLSDDEALKRAKWALELVGIDEKYYNNSPFELSGGQKRRVAIAGVIASKPEVLVLDEPTAGLDPLGKNEILEMIQMLKEKEHMCIIFVSHNMEDIAKYAERVLVFHEGKLVFDNDTKTVFSHVEELENMQLAVPQVCYILRKLKERGLCVDTSAISIEEAKESIINALNNRKL